MDREAHKPAVDTSINEQRLTWELARSLRQPYALDTSPKTQSTKTAGHWMLLMRSLTPTLRHSTQELLEKITKMAAHWMLLAWLLTPYLTPLYVGAYAD